VAGHRPGHFAFWGPLIPRGVVGRDLPAERADYTADPRILIHLKGRRRRLQDSCISTESEKRETP
jgi:hypothetical protein